MLSTISNARLWSKAAIAASLVSSLVAAPLLAATGPAAAETRVRARYALTLAGFDIGTATMQAGIDKASYDMNMSVRMTGLVKFFTGGRGAATSRGAYGDTSVSPSAYALNTKSSDKGQIIRFALAGGAIRQISVEPPPKTKDTVPVTDADKRGVVDPLSALMMPVAGTADPLDKSSCDRTLPVFDGRQRFDVTLRYDRMETATADPSAKGSYDGKLIVCKASYKAIAGHKPGREQVVFMENNKDMEVWLAPVSGTRALLPWKISVRTPIGTAVISATSFVVGAGDKQAGKGVDL
ncbi:MAG TPA: DUF3108 domain-containing protein [Hansschlegelia sp.]